MSSQSSHQTRNDIQPKKVARFTDQNEVFEYSDQKQNSDDSDLLLSPMHQSSPAAQRQLVTGRSQTTSSKTISEDKELQKLEQEMDEIEAIMRNMELQEARREEEKLREQREIEAKKAEAEQMNARQRNDYFQLSGKKLAKNEVVSNKAQLEASNLQSAKKVERDEVDQKFMLQRLEMERRKRETMGISELLKIIPVVDQSIVKSITDTRQEQWKSRKSERRLRDRITMNLKDITDILKDSPHFGNFYETEIDLKTTQQIQSNPESQNEQRRMFIMKHLELVHQKEEQKKQEVTLLKKELVDISRELEEAKRVNREIFEMFEKYNQQQLRLQNRQLEKRLTQQTYDPVQKFFDEIEDTLDLHICKYEKGDHCFYGQFMLRNEQILVKIKKERGMKADLRVTNGVIATLTEGTRTSCITLADKTMLLMNYFHAKLENEKILFQIVRELALYYEELYSLQKQLEALVVVIETDSIEMLPTSNSLKFQVLVNHDYNLQVKIDLINLRGKYLEIINEKTGQMVYGMTTQQSSKDNLIMTIASTLNNLAD